MSNETIYDVIVIGGGPSGMMAAGIAAKNNKKVLLIEKNTDLGNKLKITGGGRCNITNYELDDRKLLENYGEAAKYLFSTFSQFSVKETFTFFEKRKLPLDIQSRNRVFPKSEKAYDVYLTMKNFIKEYGVKIIYGSPIFKINTRGNEITSVDTRDIRYTAKKYVVSVGGVAAPETGSEGDGFKWMEKIGHSINRPNPNIVPLRSADNWVKEISGTTLSFMKITFFCNKKKAFSKIGKILFTHFGISGPLVLNSSKQVAELIERGRVTSEIDLFPDTNNKSLEKRILKIFDQTKNKNFKNALYELLPRKISDVIHDMMRLEIKNKKVHSITVEERKVLLNLLKHLPLSIEGLMGMDRAVVSDGGIPLSEIDTKTMQSKIIKNLYITGDMLHISRPSGGYSLQLCWTTGFVAGMNA